MMPESPDIGEFDLHAYADGQLDPARAEAVERWLADHPADAARVRSWREQNRLIQSIHATAPAKPFSWSPGSMAAKPRSGAGWMSRWRAVAAGVLLFSMGGGAGWLVNEFADTPNAETTQITSEAISAHRLYTTEVRHPVEVRADENHLLGWLSRRVGHNIVAPDIKAQGYTLVGGRLLPGAKGPAAQLMYEDRSGRRLTLYAMRTDRKGQSEFRFVENQGTRAVYWIDDDCAYALIGEIDRSALLTITRVVQAQVER